MDVMTAIMNRRSARSFKPDSIPDDVLTQVLEAGRVAPSTMHWQPWQIGVVRDAQLKQQLAEASGGQMWIATAPVVFAMCTDMIADLADRDHDDPWMIANRLRFGQPLIDYLNACPHRRAMRMYADTNDIFFAGQQMVLAGEAFGLRSCWIGYLNIERANEILRLPENVACSMLLPMGYPDTEPDPIQRKPLDSITFYDQWA